MLADLVTSGEIGQAALAILVAVIGYILHRKAHKIEVIVNGRTSQLIARVDQLEQILSQNGHSLPPNPPLPPEVAKALGEPTEAA
jgi:hypothetical protein